MPKIVSVETLKKQENDFITRVVLENLVFVLILEFSYAISLRSRALHAYVSRACLRKRKSTLLNDRRFQDRDTVFRIRTDAASHWPYVS
jgi:hypothetical protein